MNKNVDQRLSLFLSIYDELYFDDPDMSPVLEVLKQIIGSEIWFWKKYINTGIFVSAIYDSYLQ